MIRLIMGISAGLVVVVIVDLYRWMHKHYREDVKELLRLLNVFNLEIKDDK